MGALERSLPKGAPLALAALTALDQYAAVPFPADQLPHLRTFFAPVDDVHGVLRTLCESATESLVVAMYGFADPELADIIRHKAADAAIHVSLTLDSSQAGGVHERQILAEESYPNTMVAVGRSERGAIMHLKCGVIDGRWSFHGSTNWSTSGETRQDNELLVIDDRAEAARTRARIDAVHAHMKGAARRV